MFCLKRMLIQRGSGKAANWRIQGTCKYFLELAYHCTVILKYRVFSHDVTAAILVSQNNGTAAMLVSHTSPVGVEFLSYSNPFFCSNKFAQMLAMRVKTLYKYASVTRTTLHFAVGKKLTSHLNLTFHADVFRGACISSVPTLSICLFTEI